MQRIPAESHTCSITTYRFQQAAEHPRTRADKNNVQLRKAQAADKIDTSPRRTYSTVQVFAELTDDSMHAPVASAAHLNALLISAAQNLWGFLEVSTGNVVRRSASTLINPMAAICKLILIQEVSK
ncbi:uncharacterized [Tachysurus ichikawai]